ncbi:PREDICTED: uncharacterized protein LOC105565361, partial [Vollenhovia emeryi]|uniref:uncharacterized protein LOC105565361 n=1 Tax=Vollenhovia emeryi TaxID=411798 RepID=UPI0005F58826
MATSSAIHLLTAWGLNQEVIRNFLDQEIEVDQLNDLTEEDLKILIPNIGPRRKFQNNLRKYLDKITPKSVENIDSNNQLLQTIQQEDLSITNSSIKRRRTDIEAQSSSPKQYYDVDNNVTNILEDFIPTSPSESLSTSAASTEFNVTVLPNKCNVTISAETEQHATTDNEYNLESILNKSEDGQLVLSVYKSQGKLNNDL